MLNYIWLGLILCAVIVGGFTGRMDAVAQEGIKGAREAVEIALKLIGMMVLWLGAMRLAERAGLVQILARALRPVMRRLFPDVPPDHPAMGSMLMNMAANMLGIGNAATPLGLRAMQDLQKLNPNPGTATNAMCTFLAINTSSIQLIPANQIAILAAAGSARPTAIIGTALVATIVSTIVGITSVKLLEKLRWFRLSSTAAGSAAKEAPPEPLAQTMIPTEGPSGRIATGGRLVLVAFLVIIAWLFYRAAFMAEHPGPGEARVTLCVSPETSGSFTGTIVDQNATNITLRTETGETTVVGRQHPPHCPKAGDLKAQVLFEVGAKPGDAVIELHAAEVEQYTPTAVRIIDTVSDFAIPFLLAFFPLYAALRRLKVYEEFVEGAKEGFPVAIMIIPHVVAMLAAVSMFRAAGCIDAMANATRPILELMHFPTELLPMALMRPISGGGTTGIFLDLVKTYGPDHLLTRTAGTIIGSTETTLYVIAVYFGSVAIRRTRHAVAAGLLADAAGIIASVIVCRMVFG